MSRTAAKPLATPRRARRTVEEISARLLDAASAEFKRCGYAGATTAAIARTADVTEAQLFRTFGSKADLFRAAIFEPLNRHFCDFHARQQGDAADVETHREMARHYITELQAFIGEHSRMLLSMMVAQTYAPEFTAGAGGIDSLDAYFERGAAIMTDRVDAPAVDPRLMVRVSFAAVLASVLFKDWLFPPGLAGDGEINAAIIDFVLDGINANSDPALTRRAHDEGDRI